MDQLNKRIQRANFQPFYEPIKCGSLYSEHELTRTLVDGMTELLENVQIADEEETNPPRSSKKPQTLFIQDRTMSNIKLSTQFIQAACGLAAFRAPFKTTPTAVVILLLLIYLIGSLWQAFYDAFLTDGLILTLKDDRLVDGTKRKAASLNLSLKFERQRKTLSLSLTPADDLKTSVSIAWSRCLAAYRASSFKDIVCGVLWSTVTRQRSAPFGAKGAGDKTKTPSKRDNKEETAPIAGDADSGTWEWLSTPSSRQMRVDSTGEPLPTKQALAQRKKDDDAPSEGAAMGLMLDQSVTRYFDEEGLFCRDHAIEDLRSLFSRYYTQACE